MFTWASHVHKASKQVGACVVLCRYSEQARLQQQLLSKQKGKGRTLDEEVS